MKSYALIALALVAASLLAAAPLAAQDLTRQVEKFIEPREFTGKFLDYHSTDNDIQILLQTPDSTVTLSATKLYLGLIRIQTKFWDPFAKTDSMVTVKTDSSFAITAVFVTTEVKPVEVEWTIGGKRRFWVTIGDQVQNKCELRSDVKLKPYSSTTLKLKVWVEEGKTYVATVMPEKADPATPSPVHLPFMGDR